MPDATESSRSVRRALAGIRQHAREALPDSFAGAYAEADGTVAVLYAGRAPDAATVQAVQDFGARVNWRRVEHSLSHLLDLQQLLRSTRPFETEFRVKQGPVGVVIQRNAVVADLDRASPAIQDHATERFGTAVIVRQASTFRPLHEAFGPAPERPVPD